MNYFVNTAIFTLGVLSLYPSVLFAQPATTGLKIAACKLLPKEEVKKHLPWNPILDNMPIEEEPIGNYGTSCNYPSVFIQILPFSQGMIDSARKEGPLETISGVGDEAYFRNNKNNYAELYVKSGKHLLTLQANGDDGKMEAAKAGAINLAKALLPKLS